MKKLFVSPIVLVALFLFGCNGLETGADPVVVNAEKITAVAVDTFDTFFKTEQQTQDVVKEKFPEVHAYANMLRKNAPGWIESARQLTKAYKENRTPENKANLQTALAVLTQAITQVQKYTAKISTVTP